MENKLDKYFAECNKRRNQGKAQIFLTQEINLDPTREADIRDLANLYKFHVAVHFAERGKNGVHWGGTMTLIDEKSAELAWKRTIDFFKKQLGEQS